MFLLVCKVSHDEGVFVWVLVVVFADSGFGKTVLFINCDGWGIGWPNF